MISEVDPLLEGEIFVGAPGEADLEPALAQFGGELVREVEGVVLFASIAVGAGGAGIVPAMARVDDDGVDAGRGAPDIMRTHHGIEEFDQINAMDEVAGPRALDRKGEDELDLVHPHVLLADEKLDADVLFFQNELGA